MDKWVKFLEWTTFLLTDFKWLLERYVFRGLGTQRGVWYCPCLWNHNRTFMKQEIQLCILAETPVMSKMRFREGIEPQESVTETEWEAERGRERGEQRSRETETQRAERSVCSSCSAMVLFPLPPSPPNSRSQAARDLGSLRAPCGPRSEIDSLWAAGQQWQARAQLSLGRLL